MVAVLFYNLSMKLELICLDKETAGFKSFALKKIKKLQKFIKQKGEAEIYLVNSRRMRRLNKQFMKKDRPTNVLSFEKPKGFPGLKLGEVYLDPVYIKKAKEDFSLMLVHGTLHLLGYDHKKKGDRIKMEKKERSLLGFLNHV